MRFRWILLVSTLVAAACHPGPVVNAGAKQPSVGGTIAGVVSTPDPAVAVPGRKVTAVETTKGSRYDTTTAANGGYTIQVPEGTYRISGRSVNDGEPIAVEIEARSPQHTRTEAESRHGVIVETCSLQAE